MINRDINKIEEKLQRKSVRRSINYATKQRSRKRLLGEGHLDRQSESLDHLSRTMML
jgi:hypothetical protein